MTVSAQALQSGRMDKADGAFLTIGELAQELGVGQHVLRYWETRFPQLKPLQRSGNRRYYRPQDVAVARRIHRLLNVEGFTMKGALKALGTRAGGEGPADLPAPVEATGAAKVRPPADDLLQRLCLIRGELAAALEPGER